MNSMKMPLVLLAPFMGLLQAGRLRPVYLAVRIQPQPA